VDADFDGQPGCCRRHATLNLSSQVVVGQRKHGHVNGDSPDRGDTDTPDTDDNARFKLALCDSGQVGDGRIDHRRETGHIQEWVSLAVSGLPTGVTATWSSSAVYIGFGNRDEHPDADRSIDNKSRFGDDYGDRPAAMR